MHFRHFRLETSWGIVGGDDQEDALCGDNWLEGEIRVQAQLAGLLYRQLA